MNDKEKKEQELQAWLDQVHFGSCCSDEIKDCRENEKKEPSNKGSKETN